MSVPLLRVERPGLLTTVQDLGRAGRQREGVPVSGAMDPFALQVANLLAGSPRGAAALEITLLGPRLHVLAGCVVALCGADLTARLDDDPLPLWKSVRLQPGQTLRFGTPRAGARAYLAVAGGLSVPEVLGSRSTFLRGGLGGFAGRALQSGDVLAGVGESTGPVGWGLSPAAIPSYPREVTVSVLLGPQEDAFTAWGLDTFLSAVYEVTHESDRMGYRLSGPTIQHRPGGADILSEAVPLGVVQVPPSGQPLILMADRQTVGGYAKIATVISADISRVAQLAPGDKISFCPTSLADAHARLLAQERQLSLLESVLTWEG